MASLELPLELNLAAEVFRGQKPDPAMVFRGQKPDPAVVFRGQKPGPAVVFRGEAFGRCSGSIRPWGGALWFSTEGFLRRAQPEDINTPMCSLLLPEALPQLGTQQSLLFLILVFTSFPAQTCSSPLLHSLTPFKPQSCVFVGAAAVLPCMKCNVLHLNNRKCSCLIQRTVVEGF